MSQKAIITYDGLPVSRGGGHTLRVKNPLAAWDKTYHFLKTCTDFSKPDEIYLRIMKGPSIPSKFANKAIRQHLLQFGFPSFNRLLGYTLYDFKIPYKKLNEVLTTVNETCRDIPKTTNMIFGPMSLHITTKFRFVSPVTHEPFPFQHRKDFLNFQPDYRFYLGESVLYAILSSKSTNSVFFSIPFEEQTKEFDDYKQFLQNNLPFRFSDKTWKRWHINKKRTGYVGRIIEINNH